MSKRAVEDGPDREEENGPSSKVKCEIVKEGSRQPFTQLQASTGPVIITLDSDEEEGDLIPEHEPYCVSRVRFKATEPQHLEFEAGQVILLKSRVTPRIAEGTCRGRRGLFPLCLTHICRDLPSLTPHRPSPQDRQRHVKDEPQSPGQDGGSRNSPLSPQLSQDRLSPTASPLLSPYPQSPLASPLSPQGTVEPPPHRPSQDRGVADEEDGGVADEEDGSEGGEDAVQGEGLTRKFSRFRQSLNLEERFNYVGEAAMLEFEGRMNDPPILAQVALDKQAIARLLIQDARDHMKLDHLACDRAPSMLVMGQVPEACYLVKMNEATRLDLLGTVTWDSLGISDGPKGGPRVLVYSDGAGNISKCRMKKKDLKEPDEPKWELKGRQKTVAGGNLTRTVWTWNSREAGSAVMGPYIFIQGYWKAGVDMSKWMKEHEGKLSADCERDRRRSRPSVILQGAQKVLTTGVKAVLGEALKSAGGDLSSLAPGDIPNPASVYKKAAHLRSQSPTPIPHQSKKGRRDHVNADELMKVLNESHEYVLGSQAGGAGKEGYIVLSHPNALSDLARVCVIGRGTGPKRPLETDTSFEFGFYTTSFVFADPVIAGIDQETEKATAGAIALHAKKTANTYHCISTAVTNGLKLRPGDKFQAVVTDNDAAMLQGFEMNSVFRDSVGVSCERHLRSNIADAITEHAKRLSPFSDGILNSVFGTEPQGERRERVPGLVDCYKVRFQSAYEAWRAEMKHLAQTEWEEMSPGATEDMETFLAWFELHKRPVIFDSYLNNSRLACSRNGIASRVTTNMIEAFHLNLHGLLPNRPPLHTAAKLLIESFKQEYRIRSLALFQIGDAKSPVRVHPKFAKAYQKTVLQFYKMDQKERDDHVTKLYPFKEGTWLQKGVVLTLPPESFSLHVLDRDSVRSIWDSAGLILQDGVILRLNDIYWSVVERERTPVTVEMRDSGVLLYCLDAGRCASWAATKGRLCKHTLALACHVTEKEEPGWMVTYASVIASQSSVQADTSARYPDNAGKKGPVARQTPTQRAKVNRAILPVSNAFYRAEEDRYQTGWVGDEPGTSGRAAGGDWERGGVRVEQSAFGGALDIQCPCHEHYGIPRPPPEDLARFLSPVQRVPIYPFQNKLPFVICVMGQKDTDKFQKRNCASCCHQIASPSLDVPLNLFIVHKERGIFDSTKTQSQARVSASQSSAASQSPKGKAKATLPRVDYRSGSNWASWELEAVESGTWSYMRAGKEVNRVYHATGACIFHRHPHASPASFRLHSLALDLITPTHIAHFQEQFGISLANLPTH